MPEDALVSCEKFTAHIFGLSIPYGRQYNEKTQLFAKGKSGML